MVSIQCSYCKNTFEDFPSNKRKYCSRKCYEKDKTLQTLRRNTFKRLVEMVVENKNYILNGGTKDGNHS